MKSLRVYVGPTSSAKTKKALSHAKRLVRLGHDLVLIRPIKSKRLHEESEDLNEDWLVTKDGERWPAISVAKPSDILEAAVGATRVWIDEPGIFPDEFEVFGVIQQVRKKAAVIVSSISASSEMQPFGLSMPLLLAVADKIVQCFADCDECLRVEVATRSWYMPGPKTTMVVVGGEPEYQALCPRCWNKRMTAHREQLKVDVLAARK